jgi:hypothetical protein
VLGNQAISLKILEIALEASASDKRYKKSNKKQH